MKNCKSIIIQLSILDWCEERVIERLVPLVVFKHDLSTEKTKCMSTMESALTFPCPTADCLIE